MQFPIHVEIMYRDMADWHACFPSSIFLTSQPKYSHPELIRCPPSSAKGQSNDSQGASPPAMEEQRGATFIFMVQPGVTVEDET